MHIKVHICFASVEMNSILLIISGELHQLQAELSRNEAQKDTLAKELVEVSRTVDELNRKISFYEEKESNYSDMSKKYDALLQVSFQTLLRLFQKFSSEKFSSPLHFQLAYVKCYLQNQVLF